MLPRLKTLTACLRHARAARTQVLVTSVFIALLHAGAASARPPLPAELDLHTLRASQGGDGSEGVVFVHDPCADCVAVFGAHVSGLGDVTGDAVDDLIIGDPKTVPTDDSSQGGEAFAQFGQTTPFGAEIGQGSISLNLFSDTGGVDDGAGVVARIGDINGDGFSDIAVSAPNQPLTGRIAKIYVLYGRDSGFPNVFRLQELESGDGSEGVVFNGASGDDLVGQSIAGACDFNDDGIDDLIVGAPGSEVGVQDAGRVGIVFGRSDFPVVFELGDLLPGQGGDGSEGVVLTGARTLAGVGNSVACAGDVNADGIDDVVAAEATGGDGGGSAAAYLVYGHAGPFPASFSLQDLLPPHGGDGSEGTVFNAPDDVLALSPAGDVNGDGVADLLFGTPGATVSGQPDAGRAYVVYGNAGGFVANFHLQDLLPSQGGDGSEGFTLEGARMSDATGTSLGGAGDVDGDGLADLLIGAPGLPDNVSGRAFVVFGSETFGPTLALSSLLPVNDGDGRVGVVLEGEDFGVVGPGNAGTSVAGAGDLDADGFADLLVGAPDRTVDGHAGEGGAAYLVFGRSRDLDADGVVDREDNCTLEPNADQRDTNGDGFGNICDPDLDGDCFVNFIDLGDLKEVFFQSDPDADADFDGDGIINFVDLGIMKERFFGTPGPSGVAPTCAELSVAPVPHRLKNAQP